MFSPIIDSLIEDNSKDTYALLRLLRKEIPDLIPEKLPLVSLGIEEQYGGRLQIYKNIKFDPSLVKRKIYVTPDTFKPTIVALDRVRLPKNTTTTQYLKTRRQLKFAGFLSRYLKLKDKLKDSAIRDLASKMSCSLYRNTFKIVYCKTLQDHIDLYTKVKAHSCMSPSSSYKSTLLKTHLFEKYGLWPSMWYYYCPYTRGAILQVKGSLVARTILTRQSVKGKFTGFYAIYGVSEVYADLFRTLLKKKGFADRYCNYRSEVVIKSVFKVPAIMAFNQPLCPLPFHDCVENRYRCKYSKKDNVFIFGPINRHSMCVSSYGFNGYMDSTLNPADLSISDRSILNDK